MGKRVFNPHPIFDLNALREFLKERDFKPSHASKIVSHVAKEIVSSDASRESWEGIWDGIEDLPKELYTLLPDYFVPLSTRVVTKHESKGADTTKLVVELQDGLQVETVIMRYDPKKGRDASNPGGQRLGDPRATLCISSQVGCQMGCKFCATGTMGLKGNLNPAEIFEQLVHAMRVERIRNVVFMGMGEPLNNYASVCESVRLMVDRKVFGLSASHITVSTVGVTNRIKSLAADLPGVNLALSLHAPNQKVRLNIVPSSRAYPVDKLVGACRDWQEATGKKVFFEYVVLGGVNDEEEHARELGKLLQSNAIEGVVNLIPWNPTEGGAMEGFKAPQDGHLAMFQKLLRENFDIRCTIRREFGQDINSACGQLVINSSLESKQSSCSDIGHLNDW